LSRHKWKYLDGNPRPLLVHEDPVATLSETLFAAVAFARSHSASAVIRAFGIAEDSGGTRLINGRTFTLFLGISQTVFRRCMAGSGFRRTKTPDIAAYRTDEFPDLAVSAGQFCL
jgi:hypothetical protein